MPGQVVDKTELLCYDPDRIRLDKRLRVRRKEGQRASHCGYGLGQEIPAHGCADPARVSTEACEATKGNATGKGTEDTEIEMTQTTHRS